MLCSKMTEMVIELRKEYYVILAGDGNAKLGPARKDKEQENLDEALRNAVNANNTRPRHKEENRMLWITYKRKQQQRQEEKDRIKYLYS